MTKEIAGQVRSQASAFGRVAGSSRLWRDAGLGDTASRFVSPLATHAAALAAAADDHGGQGAKVREGAALVGDRGAKIADLVEQAHGHLSSAAEAWDQAEHYQDQAGRCAATAARHRAAAVALLDQVAGSDGGHVAGQIENHVRSANLSRARVMVAKAVAVETLATLGPEVADAGLNLPPGSSDVLRAGVDLVRDPLAGAVVAHRLGEAARHVRQLIGDGK